ncbi:MAG TPA: hypothetical protein VF886_04655 [Roseiarcus sp.]
MNRFLLATALVSFGLVSALAGRAEAGANLVQNGDFSQTTGALHTLDTATFSGGEIDDNYIYSGDLTDWSSPNTTPPPANYQGAYNLYFFGLANDQTTNADARYTENGQYLNANFTPPPGGGPFVGLDGDPNFTGPLEQTITGLTIGQTYQLSFYWAGGELADRTNFSTVELTVLSAPPFFPLRSIPTRTPHLARQAPSPAGCWRHSTSPPRRLARRCHSSQWERPRQTCRRSPFWTTSPSPPFRSLRPGR